MNYYEILEVSPNASPETIKAAYKSLMQRFHPDKHPGDTAIAEHAARVVQAYETLSDQSRRGAYDVALKQQSPVQTGTHPNNTRSAHSPSASRPSVAARDSSYYWILWLLFALIILSSLFALSLMKNTPTSAPAPNVPQPVLYGGLPGQGQTPDPTAGVRTGQPDTGGAAADGAAADALSRTVPQYLSDLTVYLRSSGSLPEDANRVLSVPILGLRVGSVQSQNAMQILANSRDAIRVKLEEKLASARYDSLLQPDGERYLKTMIMDVIDEATGMDRHKEYPPGLTETPGRYGVVDVILPVSYSVR